MAGMNHKKRISDLTTRAVAAAAALAMLSAFLPFAGCGGNQRGNITIGDVKIYAGELGSGWVLEKETKSDPARAQPGSTLSLLAGIGAREVLNQVFSGNGEKLQVNFVQFDSAENAADGVELFMTEEGTENVYGSTKNIAVEIIGTGDSSKARAVKLVGIKLTPGLEQDNIETANVRVEFSFACVNSIDYMKSNALSEYVEEYRESPVDPEMQATIDSTTFGDSISLLTESGSDLKAEYTFDPEPVGEQEQEGVTTFKFKPAELNQKLGIPYVDIKGKLKVGSSDLENGDGTVLDEGQKANYLAGTAFWPVSDPQVERISNDMTDSQMSDAAKVEALWRWVRENIEYTGPSGTRYGTLQVLAQRYGRCWDKSDVFVTLCRASGVPAREIAGRLAANSGGHVWAEAYIEGKGWVSVDTTSDHVGADARYLPFFATADGAMPILYVKMPTIEET